VDPGSLRLKFLLDTDRNVREQAWRATAQRYLQDQDALDEVFDKMIAVRDKIAKNAPDVAAAVIDDRQVVRVTHVDDGLHDRFKVSAPIVRREKQVLAIGHVSPDDHAIQQAAGGLDLGPGQLDGERAGFINKEFDTLCMDKIAREPEALTRYSTPELVELAGTQGVEFLNWLAMRGALLGEVSEAFRNYHIPISNTAAATMVFDNQAVLQRKAA